MCRCHWRIVGVCPNAEASATRLRLGQLILCLAAKVWWDGNCGPEARGEEELLHVAPVQKLHMREQPAVVITAFPASDEGNVAPAHQALELLARGLGERLIGSAVSADLRGVYTDEADMATVNENKGVAVDDLLDLSAPGCASCRRLWFLGRDAWRQQQPK